MAIVAADPFVQAVTNVFRTMIGLEVTVGEPRPGATGGPGFYASAIVGMSGSLSGVAAIRLPEDSGYAIIKALTGEAAADLPMRDFVDAVGELANMVVGSAKTLFSVTEPLTITVPSVVIGNGHCFSPLGGMSGYAIPCSCDVGAFVIEVFLQST